MRDFFCWLIEPTNRNTNIFTLLTVVLSGLISWFISAKYFAKGNRENLRVSLLYPMKQILEEAYSWKNYQRLVHISKEYSARYLKKSEVEIVNKLLDSYKEVCRYDYDFVCADSLFSYFKNKLEENKIDLKYEPIYVDGELVDVDFPADLLYMTDDLAKIINIHPPQYETEACCEKVVMIFNSYCKMCYEHEPIVYFDDKSFKEVINESDVSKAWDEKFEKIENAKNDFLSMDVLKK